MNGIGKATFMKFIKKYSWNFINWKISLIALQTPGGIGSVGAIDIDLPGHRALFKLSQLGFQHNLTIRPLGNTIYLYLPLVTSQLELTDIFMKLKSVIFQAVKDS